MKQNTDRLVIIGGGNIGSAIAEGVAASGLLKASAITVCDKSAPLLAALKAKGFTTSDDNCAALAKPATVLVAVKPHHADAVLAEIAPALATSKHVLVSVMAGVSIAQLRQFAGDKVPVVRAMPNTAIAWLRFSAG